MLEENILSVSIFKSVALLKLERVANPVQRPRPNKKLEVNKPNAQCPMGHPIKRVLRECSYIIILIF